MIAASGTWRLILVEQDMSLDAEPNASGGGVFLTLSIVPLALSRSGDERNLTNETESNAVTTD